MHYIGRELRFVSTWHRVWPTESNFLAMWKLK